MVRYGVSWNYRSRKRTIKSCTMTKINVAPTFIFVLNSLGLRDFDSSPRLAYELYW